VSVSLSHYCPTAAASLFRGSEDFGVIAEPGAFPGDWPFEGLDARDAFPPFLRPGVLLGFDGLRSFEDQAVRALTRGEVWSSMAVIEAAIESARSWTVERGALCDLIRSSFPETPPPRNSNSRSADPRPVLLASLTEGTPASFELPDWRPLSPSFSSRVDLVLRKYLAARLIASWITFQADDLRAIARYLRLCLDTVLLFACAHRADQEPCEDTRWKEAVRSADLWILHFCDPDLLARNLR
jgi:hypothetical protein